MVLAFGNCRLDTERRELVCGTKLVELEPMAFDLLAYLVRNRDRVVSKDDLLHAIWDGRVVSDSAITTRINAARRAVGDDGAAQRLIRTVTRKGFRFVGEVTEQCASSFPVGNGYHECRSAEIPSIAILPFRTSGDLARDGFADAMVEEIATALSRIRWLRVIVRDLAFAHRDPGFNIQAAARELGVRYVLEGSVRTAGKRVRITVRLIEAATGAHLWAEPFDGSSRPAFDLQKSVVSSVAGAIEPVLQASEAALSLDSLPGDLSAYKAYLRALAMFKTSSRQIPQALAAAEEAIGRDPNCGLALTLAARCCMLLCLDGSSKHPERDQRKGLDFARRALLVASDDAGTLANAAMVSAYFGQDIGTGIALVDRALRLNVNSARAWHVSGMLRNWSGQPDIAIEHAENASQLSPRGGVGPPIFIIGISHLIRRRLDEALAALLLASQEMPTDFADVYRLQISCYTQMGRLGDAREVLQRLQGITPVLSQGFSYLRKSEHRELLSSGLHLAIAHTDGRSFHELIPPPTQAATIAASAAVTRSI
jgi:TolB-like protein